MLSLFLEGPKKAKITESVRSEFVEGAHRALTLFDPFAKSLESA